jgi:glycosyltransferase involved in cell wall biosynthesis
LTLTLLDTTTLQISASRAGYIALVGRRDEPTDALRDYCAYLQEALGRQGANLEIVEARWDQQGWLRTISKIWKESARWRGQWILFQYTALMWSRRGFPFSVLVILLILKLRGCHTAVVFHDVYASPGARLVQKIRSAVQRWIMGRAYRFAARSIFPVPLDRVPWLSPAASQAIFIPVGANVPSIADAPQENLIRARESARTVAVFGVTTWPSAQKQEIEAIVGAMRRASAELGDLNLLVIGRGARAAEQALREGLANRRVSVTVDGLVSSQEITLRLSRCDVLLFVRGHLSSRRGSGLAGIACGLPIVAYQGRETGFPVSEAGVLLVPEGDADQLAQQLIRVLGDGALRSELRRRNVAVLEQHFSWDAIACRYLEAFSRA